ncbi:MAG: hypothetical protein ACSHW0_16315 [Thalassotalea sp.]
MQIRHIFLPIQRFIRQRFERFLAKRIPAKPKQVLSNRNIFILPSKFGIAYLFFILLLFLLGTNYQNNIILLLSYLLGSFFITAMLQSFFNLAGISIEIAHSPSGFAEQKIDVPLNIMSNKPRFDLHFQLPQQAISHCEIINQGDNQLTVPFIKDRRGNWTTGRLKVFSAYGFGLFTTWSTLDFGLAITVYPKASSFDLHFLGATNVNSLAVNESNYQATQMQAGQDEFFELSAYKKGEPNSHVAWKQVAKGQGWFTKQYRQDESSQHCLKLQNMPATKLEDKLEQLCFVILEYCQLGLPYSVELLSQQIANDHGDQHAKQCLKALALYGDDNTEKLAEGGFNNKQDFANG